MKTPLIDELVSSGAVHDVHFQWRSERKQLFIPFLSHLWLLFANTLLTAFDAKYIDTALVVPLRLYNVYSNGFGV